MSEETDDEYKQIVSMGFPAWKWGFMIQALMKKQNEFLMAEEKEIADRLIREIRMRGKAQTKRNATFRRKRRKK